ncbi:uncharacterized protein LOC117587096 [Drosophila guanche]|uniref:Uncharacterized protein n=1 Tax=Drosophila guanche TaxID=7266 RepID=A0A3B0JV72_DROGU|nr:uncharacterized protein LOC117587096 [Drosophila guanche]SPP84963.1 Hypothetical predicted protein [Drosophila guanche]
MWRQGKQYGLGDVLPLAIGLLLCSAQTQSSVTSLRRTAAAAGDAAAAAQILEDAQPSSVVQDWSLVCKELCGAGLGVATPGEAHSTILRPEIDAAKCGQLCGLPRDNVGDRLCTSYCQQRHRSLSGCSPCQVQEVKEEASAVQGNATHGPRTEEYQEAAVVAVAVAAASDGETTATPDWNELCKSLCKTGDGGSLCNCDLSPFFT